MKQLKHGKENHKIIIFLIVLTSIAIFFLIYKIFNSGYTIKLVGPKEFIVYLNENYNEPGYIAYNKDNEDVTSKVKVTGNVNTEKEGIYRITYKIGMVKVYRNVIVKYNLQNDISINFEGDNPLYILKDNKYSFDDCKAFDKEDGNITSKIVVKNQIDFSKIGEYEITYSVVNSRGTEKKINRKVVVYDIDYTITKNMLNNNAIISMNFDKTYFEKVKLPDGTFNENEIVNYTFSENGVYVFEIYDKYGYVKKIQLTISEIDNTFPTGSCVVNLYDDTTKVVVNASDNQGIKGYVYKYGNKTSEMISSNEFSYDDMVDNVQVSIYDNANNNIDITCKVNDLSTKYPRTYTTQHSVYNYKLYIPSTLSKRNKFPLVIFLHGSGECGSNINKIEVNSFPKYIKEGEDYDFVMIAPQIPSAYCLSWNFRPADLKSIIDEVVSKYPIDSNRIIITGFSLGGMSTYKMIKTYPTFFAGAMPLAARTDYDDALLQTDIWAFHGTGDGTYYEDKKVMDKVILGNSNSKFTTYNASHNITELVYKDPTVIEWIINKRRK